MTGHVFFFDFSVIFMCVCARSGARFQDTNQNPRWVPTPYFPPLFTDRNFCRLLCSLEIAEHSVCAVF